MEVSLLVLPEDVLYHILFRTCLHGISSISCTNHYLRRLCKDPAKVSRLLNKHDECSLLVSQIFRDLDGKVKCCSDDSGLLVPFLTDLDVPELLFGPVVGVLDCLVCLVDKYRRKGMVFSLNDGFKVNFDLPERPLFLRSVTMAFGQLGKDYIVFVHYNVSEDASSAYSFSLEKRIWKSIQVCPYGDLDGEEGSSVFDSRLRHNRSFIDHAESYNGKLYFACHGAPFGVLVFDLETETYSMLNVQFLNKYITVGVLNRKLCISQVIDEKTLHCLLFDGSSYDNLYVIVQSPIFGGLFAYARPLYYLRDGSLLLLKDGAKLIRTNPSGELGYYNFPDLRGAFPIFDHINQRSNEGLAADFFGMVEKEAADDLFGMMENEAADDLFGMMENEAADDVFGMVEKEAADDSFGMVEKEVADDVFGMVEKEATDDVFGERKLKEEKGVGRTLGSSSTLAAPAATNSARTPSLVLVDETSPTTLIQLRFADGTRMKAVFNYYNTVNDIRASFDASHPGGDRNYQLMVGFPPKVLSDPTLTIEQAGLAECCIIQKFL